MSLICQRCNQAKATVHITDTLPQKREQHLCEGCAEKEGVIVKPHHTMNEILQQFVKKKTVTAEAGDLKCDQCGVTFHDFQVNGQLGCPNDYLAFRALLEPLIERAHAGATNHVGKVPISAGTAAKKSAGLLRLRKKLEDAIEEENYESAARVRDQIQELETS